MLIILSINIVCQVFSHRLKSTNNKSEYFFFIKSDKFKLDTNYKI